MLQQRAEWSNRMVFILAAAGSAVGLGNIWRFPYVAGTNGGGAFMLVYLVCVFLVGLPIMVAELLIGRASRQAPPTAFEKLGGNYGKYWKLYGWAGLIAAFILSSFYCVVGGWTLSYVFKSFMWNIQDLTQTTTEHFFSVFTSDPLNQILWTFIFIFFSITIVLRGLKNGLEAFNKIFMPILLVMILLLVINALTCEGAWQGIMFLFNPDFSKITPEIILSAMGQAFFSLSLGMGAILTYGSYLHHREQLVNVSFAIVMLDTAVAILVGLAIFPVLFASGMDPAQGPGLTFIVLPVAFSNFGTVLGPILITIFFMLLSFAALTSSISIIEPVVAHVVDKNILSRTKATLCIGGFIFLCSIPSALSQGAHEFFSSSIFLGKNFMGFAEFIVVENILPLGGFAMALFVYFVLSGFLRRREVRTYYLLWRPALLISAICVAIVYLQMAYANKIWFAIACILLLLTCVLVYHSKEANTSTKQAVYKKGFKRITPLDEKERGSRGD